MRTKTHNGFKLDYDGFTFGANSGNQISYECFCLMGGLANGRLAKIQRFNGKQSYITYHRIDRR